MFNSGGKLCCGMKNQFIDMLALMERTQCLQPNGMNIRSPADSVPTYRWVARKRGTSIHFFSPRIWAKQVVPWVPLVTWTKRRVVESVVFALSLMHIGSLVSRKGFDSTNAAKCRKKFCLNGGVHSIRL